eukprot:13347523-Alexandrium_andersonii.AAC.1
MASAPNRPQRWAQAAPDSTAGRPPFQTGATPAAAVANDLTPLAADRARRRLKRWLNIDIGLSIPG